ncbi:MAG: phosphatidate cytidylyltransferase [Candidatus Saccharibacteria bacterium]|nr:phosphatidate cytidylyltransferase [Candidatus Saccharibacteria bacterium]
MDKLLQPVPLLMAILIAGFVACLPLYQWNIKKFITSSLGIKVLMWIPLYMFFVFVASQGVMAAVLAAGVIGLFASVEFFRQHDFTKSWWYFVYFMVALAGWIGSVAAISRPELWMTLTLSSVFSDVIAFFMGNYMGKHHLPQVINPRKSYEGAAGQIIGGILGAILFGSLFGVEIPLWVGGIIGAASLVGDLLNSVAKRLLNIKDWGNTIPGHGGMMDRFSSLNLALCLMWLLYAL